MLLSESQPTDLARIEAEEDRRSFVNTRPRHPDNDAASFVENYLSPGSRLPLSVYSSPLDGFIPVHEARRHEAARTSMWAEAEEDVETLFNLMRQVQAKFGQSSTSMKASGQTSAITISEARLRDCNWAHVMAEVQSAANSWRSRPHKDSKAMVFIDTVGQSSGALEAWVQLLPGGDYGSAICGAFRIAINAAGQYGKVQESVIEALAEIPRVMENAARYVDIYRRMPNQYLDHRSFELFRAVIKSLSLIFQFMLEGKRKKAIGIILKQDSYGQDLRDSLKEIDKCVQNLKDEAEICNARRSLLQGNIISGLSEQVDTQGAVLQAVYKLLCDDLIRRERISDGSSNTTHTPESRLLRPGYDVANIHRTSSDFDDAEFTSNQSEIKRLGWQKDVKKLRKLLHSRRERASDDLGGVLRFRGSLEGLAASRGSSFIQADTFRKFVSNASSQSLLVNGMEDGESEDGPSPVGSVAARLVDLMEQAATAQAPTDNRGHILVLKYFCNIRRRYRLGGDVPRYAPVAEMTASLLSQLLQQMDNFDISSDLSFLSTKQWSYLASLKPRTVMLVLYELIRRLSEDHIVVFVIDQACEYEGVALREKTESAISVLTHLTKYRDLEENSGKRGPIVKLLLTCRTQALHIGSYFGRDEILNLEEIEEDTAAEWTVQHFAL